MFQSATRILPFVKTIGIVLNLWYTALFVYLRLAVFEPN